MMRNRVFGLAPGFFWIGLLLIILAIYPYWRIFRKAGYSGALSLLLLLPVVNVITLYAIGWSDWPIERELRELRAAKAR